MFKRSLITLMAIILLSTVSAMSVKAQFILDYSPIPYNEEKADLLLDSLGTSYKTGIKKLKSHIAVKQLKTITLKLMYLVEDHAFLDDPIYDDLIHSILDKIKTGNQLNSPVNHILISRDPSCNAYTVGNGIIIINTGLLRRIKSEDELAYIIAHEIAHNELNHPFSIFEKNGRKDRRKAIRYTSEINESENSLEDLTVIQTLMYDAKKFSRMDEFEADSLGFSLFVNAGYDKNEALNSLGVLDSNNLPKYPQGELLFEPFYFSKYPMKYHWIRSRPKGYTNQPKLLMAYDADSLSSHPEITDRLFKLQEHLGIVENPDDKSVIDHSDQIELVSQISDFENIHAAIYQKKYDVALYQALQLRRIYPGNSYLNQTITQVLVELSEAKSKGEFDDYVQLHVVHFHSELQQINAFLFNLNSIELGELAYHFISSPSIFNENVDAHHELLIKTAKLTGRKDIKKLAQAKYQQKQLSIYAQTSEE